MARATGACRIVINSGAKSEKYIRNLYPELPPQAFVHYGNFIGETIGIAAELGISRLTLVPMMEIPPTTPSRGLKVRAATSSPPGTEMVTWMGTFGRYR